MGGKGVDLCGFGKQRRIVRLAARVQRFRQGNLAKLVGRHHGRRLALALPGNARQKAREVKQELRARRLRLPGNRQPAVTCVVAREIDAPTGVKRVVWRL